MSDKILTGMDDIDNILSNGLTNDEISLCNGISGLGKTHFMVGIQPKDNIILYDVETANHITEMGSIHIKKVSEFIGDNSSVTKNEEIGGIIFPVTYFKDGMVIVDYPNKL